MSSFLSTEQKPCYPCKFCWSCRDVYDVPSFLFSRTLVLSFLERTLEAVKVPPLNTRCLSVALDGFAFLSRQDASSPRGTATFIRSVKDFSALVLPTSIRSLTCLRSFILLPISKRILSRRVLKGNARVEGKSARTKFNSPATRKAGWNLKDRLKLYEGVWINPTQRETRNDVSTEKLKQSWKQKARKKRRLL